MFEQIVEPVEVLEDRDASQRGRADREDYNDHGSVHRLPLARSGKDVSIEFHIPRLCDRSVAYQSA